MSTTDFKRRDAALPLEALTDLRASNLSLTGSADTKAALANRLEGARVRYKLNSHNEPALAGEGDVVRASDDRVSS